MKRENLVQTQEYARGDILRASTVNALVRAARAEGTVPYGLTDGDYGAAYRPVPVEDRRYDIPFRKSSTVFHGPIPPHGLLWPEGIAVPGDEEYTAVQNTDGYSDWANEARSLYVNGPFVLPQSSGSASPNGMCGLAIEGGWIAYDHADDDPQPGDEWYADKTTFKLTRTTKDANRWPFMALGGFRKFEWSGSELWVGRFAQILNRATCFGQLGPAYGGTVSTTGASALGNVADGDLINFGGSTGAMFNAKVTVAGSVESVLRVGLPGLYQLSVFMSAIVERDYVSTPLVSYGMDIIDIGICKMPVGGVLGDEDHQYSMRGGAGYHTDTTWTTASLGAHVLIPLDRGEGICFRNDTGLTVTIAYNASVLLRRVEPYCAHYRIDSGL